MTTTRRWLRGLLAALTLTVALTACTPDELRAYLDLVGYDHSSWTQEDYEEQADYISKWFDAYYASLTTASWDRYYHVLSEDQLYRLRMCESGGNYAAIGGGGAYRGAYQFARGTWNAVASANYPNYVGMDPAGAPAAVQDAMARALFAAQGRSPWPVCGYRM